MILKKRIIKKNQQYSFIYLIYLFILLLLLLLLLLLGSIEHRASQYSLCMNRIIAQNVILSILTQNSLILLHCNRMFSFDNMYF